MQESPQLGNRRALLLALLLAVISLGASLLPGRSLLPQDTRAFEPWRSELDRVQRDGIDAGSVPHRRDKLLQFLPFDTAVRRSLSEGEAPLWNPNILCGVPQLAQATARACYPTSLAFLLFSPESIYAWLYLLHLGLAGLFAYRLARVLGASEEGALLADIAFVLSGYAIAHLHHPMIFEAALWSLPALEQVFRLFMSGPGHGRERLRSATLLAICVALSWLAGFFQASLLLTYTIIAYSVYLFLLPPRPGKGRPWGPAALAAGGLSFGILLALVQILPTLELAAHSIRETADWKLLSVRALPVAGLLDYLLPGQLAPPMDFCPISPDSVRPSFLTLALLPTDAAKNVSASILNFNHTETALSVGIWPLIFALMTLPSIFRKDTPRQRRLILVLLWVTALFGLLVVTGVKSAFGLIQLLPGLSEGDLKRWILLPTIALPLLAGLGFRSVPQRQNLLFASLGCMLALIGLITLSVATEDFAAFMGGWIAPRYGYTKDIFLDNLQLGEAELNRRWISFGLLLQGAALLTGSLSGRSPRSLLFGVILATGIGAVPLAWYASPAPRAASVAEAPKLLQPQLKAPGPTPRLLVHEAIPAAESRRAPGDLRVYPPNLPSVHGFAQITGYVPIPPRRAEEFFAEIDRASVSHGAGVGTIRDPAALRSPLLELCAPDLLLASSEVALPEWKELGRAGSNVLYGRKERLPRVRIYHEWKLVSRERVSEELSAEGFDPRRSLLLEEKPGFESVKGSGPQGTVSYERLANGEIRLDAKLESPALLFVSEAFDRGWHYRIDDGAEAEVLAANLYFQAVPVPLGKHRVVLRYSPSSYVLGFWVSLLSLVLVLSGLFYARRHRSRA